jgi:hypothetical protein
MPLSYRYESRSFALLAVSQWAAAQDAPPALRLPDFVRRSATPPS